MSNYRQRFTQVTLATLLLLCWLVTSVGADSNLVVGAFSKGDLTQWEPYNFQGLTTYQLVTDATQQRVLKAYSNDSASGLIKKQRIDLNQTPFITWRWKVTHPLNALSEHTKAGDDYAARIYIIIDGGLLFWQSKGLNYVWSSSSPKQSTWSNAYAGDAVKMLALRAKEDPLDTWYTEKRNIREDFKQIMGLEVQFIDAIALMSDTDNSHATATAFYGDIAFSQH